MNILNRNCTVVFLLSSILIFSFCGDENLTVQKKQFKFIITKNSIDKKWWEKQYPTWEAGTFEVFDKYARNQNVLDVGGWIGPTALYLGKISNYVWVLEPNLPSYNELAANIGLNGLQDRIRALRVALSNKTGYQKFCDKSDSMGSLVRECENMNIVPTISVSDLMKKIKTKIDFIKIDIEGGERIVVPEMEKVFQQHKPVCFISLHPTFISREEILSITQILKKYFNLFKIDGKTPFDIESATQKKRHMSDSDILCIPK